MNQGDPTAAFAHNIPAAPSVSEIWQALLVCIALLFPIDVALRRLRLNRGDLRKAGAYLAERGERMRQAFQPRPQITQMRPDQPEVLGQLFQARDRARQRERNLNEMSEARDIPPAASGEAPPVSDRPAQPAVDETRPQITQITQMAQMDAHAPGLPTGPDEDALQRLRDAKKRARR